MPEMFAKECFPDFDSKNQLVHWPILNNETAENRVELDKESMAVKMDNEAWKYTEKVCYVSCKNVSDSPVSFTEKELMAPEMTLRYALYTEAFGRVSGAELSNAERRSKKLTSSEFTYGEIEFVHFVPLLKMAAKTEDGVFWDLGCGTGKALVAAAAGYNKFEKICGVEYLACTRLRRRSRKSDGPIFRVCKIPDRVSVMCEISFSVRDTASDQ